MQQYFEIWSSEHSLFYINSEQIIVYLSPRFILCYNVLRFFLFIEVIFKNFTSLLQPLLFHISIDIFFNVKFNDHLYFLLMIYILILMSNYLIYFIIAESTCCTNFRKYKKALVSNWILLVAKLRNCPLYNWIIYLYYFMYILVSWYFYTFNMFFPLKVYFKNFYDTIL